MCLYKCTYIQIIYRLLNLNVPLFIIISRNTQTYSNSKTIVINIKRSYSIMHDAHSIKIIVTSYKFIELEESLVKTLGQTLRNRFSNFNGSDVKSRNLSINLDESLKLNRSFLKS